jgi:hypothetical protein
VVIASGEIVESSVRRVQLLRRTSIDRQLVSKQEFEGGLNAEHELVGVSCVAATKKTLARGLMLKTDIQYEAAVPMELDEKGKARLVNEKRR